MSLKQRLIEAKLIKPTYTKVDAYQLIAQQEASAKEVKRQWDTLIEAGYTEVVPGMLRSPDGQVEMWFS